MNPKGEDIYSLAQRIFPYCRSITGEGVRKTLKDLKEYVEKDTEATLSLKEIPSGTQVFDWTVPKEWVIREAYIEDEAGNHIIDMKEHNLHVLGYSTPVDAWVDLEELKSYIYTEPDQPEVIPYVTSYYKERYGFCMSENQKNSLKPGRYHMYIDSELKDGVLNYGEVVIPGESKEEIFFSTYICHPSMANNECSGLALSATLVRFVSGLKKRRYTYRFLYIPETIGSISYLSQENHLQHMKDTMVAGFVLSCVGDNRDYSIIESKYADTLSDKVLKNILKYHTSSKYQGGGSTYATYSFLERGSDERQYNAPGVDLPVVCFSRSSFNSYPEYHTSADNMELVSPDGFQGSFEVMTKVIQALEYNQYYKIKVLCEPQLGKRGLYPAISKKGSYDEIWTMMNFITYADGRNDLIEISDRIGVPIDRLVKIVDKLHDNDLLEEEE
jgi:aminopeptidase-like protein